MRIALIEDIFGRFAIVFESASRTSVEVERAVRFSNLDELVVEKVWYVGSDAEETDKLFFVEAWEGASALRILDNFRIVERYRSKAGWFSPPQEPLWAVASGPPIIVFYSFKGGVGRTTALASFALNRARAGDRVAIVDADIDAPGVASLFQMSGAESAARWGLVDYLLESAFIGLPLDDYYQTFRDSKVVEAGEIITVPAGRLDLDYLGKSARLDFEPVVPNSQHPLMTLLVRVRNEVRPDWILLDARAGLSDAAGLLLNGFAHLYVLVCSDSEQNWCGIKIILDRIGAQRVKRNMRQCDCIVLQTLIPPKGADAVISHGIERSGDAFTEHYYATSDEENEDFWTVADIESDQSPHWPIPIRYRDELAFFESISDVIDTLTGQEYAALMDRIVSRTRIDENA